MDALVQDVRYAVRGLIRSPGFAALTVLCLALGIGVNSAVCSIADNVSLRPLPFEEPDRLVALYSSAGAFMVTRFVRAILYNVTPTDPVSFGGMALVLAAVTVLAGCVPAGRATRVDPIRALRAD